MGSDLVAWVQIWWYGFRFDGMGSLLVAWVYSSVILVYFLPMPSATNPCHRPFSHATGKNALFPAKHKKEGGLSFN